MEFNLFKNITPEILQSAFVKSSKEEGTEDFTEISLQNLKEKHGSSIKVDLFPKGNLRKKGTLQKGQVKISSKRWKYNQDFMYLVVSCNRKWAKKDEVDIQRYALIVSISHSNTEVDLYSQIRLQTRVAQRARIR